MHTPWLSYSQTQLRYLAYSWYSQMELRCLSCLLPVVSPRPFFWGMSPLMWLAWAMVTPGEWYASDEFTQTRHDLRHTCDISAAVDCTAVIQNYLISRRLCLPPEDVSPGRDGDCGFPKIDCAAADSGVDEMNDLIFSLLSLLPDDDFDAFELDRRIRRQRECCRGCLLCDAMKIAVMIFRRTNLPPDEFSAWRNGDYIWHDLSTEPSVCNRPVTGSHGFGSSHRL